MFDESAGEGERIRVIGDDEGEALWFLGGLMVVKADTRLTEGRLAFLDQTVPANFAPPRHIHRDEDEAFYILEGEVTFLVSGERLLGRPGTFAFLPKGLEHAFIVGPAGARMLTLTTPASFGEFVRELGQPAASRALPPPKPPTEEEQRHLAEVAARYGIEITGPPPGPEEARA